MRLRSAEENMATDMPENPNFSEERIFKANERVVGQVGDTRHSVDLSLLSEEQKMALELLNAEGNN